MKNKDHSLVFYDTQFVVLSKRLLSPIVFSCILFVCGFHLFTSPVFGQQIIEQNELEVQKAQAKKYLVQAYRLLANKSYDAALAQGKQSASIYQKIGLKNGEAIAHEIIGSAYLRQREYNLAQESYEKSESLYVEIGYLSGESRTQLALGEISIRNKFYNQARSQIDQSMSLALATSNKRLELKAILKLLELDIITKNLNAAALRYRYLNRERRNIIANKQGRIYARLLVRYAHILETDKKLEQAETIYKEALELGLDAKKDSRYMAAIGIGLTRILRNSKRTDEAIRYLTKINTLFDNIDKNEYTLRIAALRSALSNSIDSRVIAQRQRKADDQDIANRVISIINQAQLEVERGNIGKVENLITEAKKNLNVIEDITAAYLFILEANVATKKGEYIRAKEKTFQAQAIFVQENEISGLGDAARLLANIGVLNDDFDNVLQHIEEANGFYAQTKNLKGQAYIKLIESDFYYLLTRVDKKSKRNFEKAYDHALDSYELALQIEDSNNLRLSALLKLAQLSLRQNRADIANEQVIKAQSYVSEVTSATNRFNVANVLGLLKEAFGKPKEAIEHHINAYNIALKNNFPLEEAESQLRIGLILIQVKDMKQASVYIEESKKLYTKLEDHVGIANCYMGLAEIAIRLRKKDEAKNFLKYAAQEYDLRDQGIAAQRARSLIKKIENS